MKKLVFASVALVGVCCGSILCTPAFAQADGQAGAAVRWLRPAHHQGCGGI